MAEDSSQQAMFVKTWPASGVTCVRRNSGEEGNAVERVLPRLAHNTYVTDQLPASVARITEARDIIDAKHASGVSASQHSDS